MRNVNGNHVAKINSSPSSSRQYCTFAYRFAETSIRKFPFQCNQYVFVFYRRNSGGGGGGDDRKVGVYKLRLRVPRLVLPFHFRRTSSCRTFPMPARSHCESAFVCVCAAFHNNQWQLVHQQQSCYWFTYDFISAIRSVPR